MDTEGPWVLLSEEGEGLLQPLVNDSSLKLRVITHISASCLRVNA